MYEPDYDRFVKLAGQGNLIPLYREIMIDMETPVSILARFGPGTLCLSSRECGRRGKVGEIYLSRRSTAEDCTSPWARTYPGRGRGALHGNRTWGKPLGSVASTHGPLSTCGLTRVTALFRRISGIHELRSGTLFRTPTR